jgi:hypothetical protein
LNENLYLLRAGKAVTNQTAITPDRKKSRTDAQVCEIVAEPPQFVFAQYFRFLAIAGRAMTTILACSLFVRSPASALILGSDCPGHQPPRR